MGSISAARVEDRTAYVWEEWPADQHFADATWDSDATIGPCKVWRNRYSVLANLCVTKDAASYVENTWLPVIAPGSLPVGWRPLDTLWEVRESVEGQGMGPLFQMRVTASGDIDVYMLGDMGFDWQRHSRIPIYFAYPRSNA